jgi:hypothetical protein
LPVHVSLLIMPRWRCDRRRRVGLRSMVLHRRIGRSLHRGGHHLSGFCGRISAGRAGCAVWAWLRVRVVRQPVLLRVGWMSVYRVRRVPRQLVCARVRLLRRGSLAMVMLLVDNTRGPRMLQMWRHRTLLCVLRVVLRLRLLPERSRPGGGGASAGPCCSSRAFRWRRLWVSYPEASCLAGRSSPACG